MPRGGARVGAGNPNWKRKSSGQASSATPSVGEHVGAPSPAGQTPLEYMLAVIRDQDADESRRDRLAVAAAPYMHAKVGEGGKKDERKLAAQKAGAGKFAPAAPPRLVASGGATLPRS